MVAPRFAIQAAEVAATAVMLRISAWDASTALLLLPFLTNSQPNHPASTSAAHLAGTKPLRAAIGAVRKVMVITEVATHRARGGGKRPEAADVEGDEVQSSKGALERAASTAPALPRPRRVGADASTRFSRPRGLPSASTSANVLAGIHSAPEATWRRFQPPQPALRGALAGVVGQPASTVGGVASAPPRKRRPRAAEGTRLEERQPRPPGRLAALLDLPCRSGPASEHIADPTGCRSWYAVSATAERRG
jgi:hypothetical protein